MMEPTFKVFAVEDDPAFSRLLRYSLELDPEHEVKMFTEGQELLEALHENPDLVTLDYSLPDISGEAMLQRILREKPELPVVLISGQDDIQVAIDLLKQGAYDYLTKNNELKTRLFQIIHHLREKQAMANELENLKEQVSEKYQLDPEGDSGVIGKSPGIRKVFQLAKKAAKTQISVSVTGETGTGKEVVARAIHQQSERKEKPFVPINMSAIPADLLESELFGHEKGAFTGANARRIGKFEEAQGGTLFLDEIAEMPLELQAKLLRVLQERELVRVGSNKPIALDVRVISATHQNIRQAIGEGQFREDLYYRLIGLPIEIPPLRERAEDIPLLAVSFLKQFAKDNGLGVRRFSQKALNKLAAHSFPGNVRELKALVELAAVMAESDTIQPEDIVFHSSEGRQKPTDDLTLQEHVHRIVRDKLERHNNNIMLVAQKLDISRSTIYRYLKEMDHR